MRSKQSGRLAEKCTLDQQNTEKGPIDLRKRNKRCEKCEKTSTCLSLRIRNIIKNRLNKFTWKKNAEWCRIHLEIQIMTKYNVHKSNAIAATTQSSQQSAKLWIVKNVEHIIFAIIVSKIISRKMTQKVSKKKRNPRSPAFSVGARRHSPTCK